ncbi:SRPBCC family protein [Sciscionella marina]|uniref:SRPBCC family protein n=1 Tax=Sciscionella marina TaxID=508770 RepID=UPI00036625D6|nr:SRPBCC family protein [Sciscionella marina]
MRLHNEFTVNAPIDKTWEVLTDIERIAPCMPGAQLTGAEGDVYSGQVKIKVGPVTTTYSGTITFTEKDPTQHHAVIHAKGKETRGSGNASATITAGLRESGEKTTVTVDTDLTVTGKVAQFGSGMIQEVSEKLLGRFTTALEAEILPKPTPEPVNKASGTTGEARTGPTGAVAPAATRPGTHSSGETAPVDVLSLAGDSVAKRALPVAAAVLALVAVVIMIGRGRGNTSS